MSKRLIRVVLALSLVATLAIPSATVATDVPSFPTQRRNGWRCRRPSRLL